MLFLLVSIILAAPFLGIAEDDAKEDPRIKFQNASLIGSLKNNIISYLGIPYAQPPIGTQRFKPPQPIKLSGEIKAKAYGKSCIQQNSKGIISLGDMDDSDSSEDCLTINVFSPQNATKLPVIAWIHGGAFSSGSSSLFMYNGENILSVRKDFVFVSFNYRLGVMGWMASEALEKEGSLNVGLLDQRLALQWIKDNIQLFGGDPGKITAVGESAGAISIGVHLLSQNGGQSLFSKAILLSGATPYYYPPAKQLQTKFDAFAESLGCKPNDIECLRAVDTFKLRTAANDLPFGPVLDGNYIQRQSLKSLGLAAFSKIPLLIHTNQDEGSIFSIGISSEKEASQFMQETTPYYDNKTQLQLEGLYAKYEPSQKVSRYFADDIFNCPAKVLSDYYANAGLKVYSVINKHVNKMTKIADTFIDLGVYHSSELAHFFQSNWLISSFEQEFSLKLHNQYIDFAVMGDPGWPDYAVAKNQFDIENNKIINNETPSTCDEFTKATLRIIN